MKTVMQKNEEELCQLLNVTVLILTWHLSHDILFSINCCVTPKLVFLTEYISCDSLLACFINKMCAMTIESSNVSRHPSIRVLIMFLYISIQMEFQNWVFNKLLCDPKTCISY